MKNKIIICSTPKLPNYFFEEYKKFLIYEKRKKIIDKLLKSDS